MLSDFVDWTCESCVCNVIIGLSGLDWTGDELYVLNCHLWTLNICIMSFVDIVDLNICIMLFVTCEYNVFNYMNYVVTFKIMNLNLNLFLLENRL